MLVLTEFLVALTNEYSAVGNPSTVASPGFFWRGDGGHLKDITPPPGGSSPPDGSEVSFFKNDSKY